MTIHDLDTPALMIDVKVLDGNLRKMATYCNDHKLALRPHTKTHKMPEIARLQLQHGAAGITVAKLGEAEVMADAGIEDILIVYPLWGEKKWARLADLAARVRWDWILVYPGRIMSNQTIREHDIECENETMDALFELLGSASIPYPVVSGGNTPAAFASHRFHGLTEIRPGTYVFNDRNTVDAESAEFANCALTVLVT